MDTRIQRHPAPDDEVQRFEELVERARVERLVQPNCFFMSPLIEGDDVLVTFVSPRGSGLPGKRYVHAPGWLREFERDLWNADFLTV